MKTPEEIYRLSYIIFLIAATGLLMELLLIGHLESFWQIFPVVLLSVAVTNAVLFYYIAHRFVFLIFNFLTIILMISGFIGIGFHLHNNWEFTIELHPGESTFQLITDMLTGAIPAVAPGAMIVSGLVGKLLILVKNKIILK